MRANGFTNVDKVFQALRKYPRGLTAIELAAETGIGTNTMAAIVSKLFMYGRLSRRPVPDGLKGVRYQYQWGGVSENAWTRSPKLNHAKARSIREMWASGRYLQKEIGAKFGVSQRTVSGIVRGKAWQERQP